jgi:hypothetical protein
LLFAFASPVGGRFGTMALRMILLDRASLAGFVGFLGASVKQFSSGIPHSRE